MLFPAPLAKKERLSCAVLEGMYAVLYGVVDRSLRETDGMPISACAAKTVLAVRKRLSATGETWF